MLRLTSLTIHKFRNVATPCTLEFSDTFNVLLGKNATGKTTLLKLIVAAINGDFGAFHEDLEVAWTLEEGLRALRVRVVRVPVTDVRGDRVWMSWWSFDASTDGNHTGTLEVRDGEAVWRPPNGTERPTRVPLGVNAQDAIFHGTIRLDDAIGDRPSDLLVWFRDEAERFDEALARFDLSLASGWTLVRRNGESSTEIREAGPSTHALLLAWERPFDSSEVSLTKADFTPPLKRVVRLLGDEEIVVEPTLVRETRQGESRERQYSGVRVTRLSSGESLHSDLWSFGQKRLFAFFWHLAAFDRTPVVADELLNGLHHEWIQACLDELYERQSFLATQHPLLLDHIPIDDVEAARKTFIRCTSEKTEDGDNRLVWRNFTEKEATDFYRAYQANVQQVSEILRTDGLW